MNTKTHTVTLPIEDYQELICAQSLENNKVKRFKDNLTDRLKALTEQRVMDDQGIRLIRDIITCVKEA